jgi:hypothetical protein
MVRSGTPHQPSGDQTPIDQTLGDLVALAAKDVSQLVRYEIDLAKSELKTDAKRLGVAAGLIAVGVFFGCFILICVTFAWVYGLNAMGLPGGMWAAFLVAGFSFLLVAAIAIGAGIWWLKRKRLFGMSKTRQSVSEGIGMLRRDSAKDDDTTKAADDVTAVANGQRPQIAGDKPR